MGRAEELEALSALWLEAAQGSLRMLLIEGEAGIGKSAFLDEGSRRAVRLDYRVFRTSCLEHEQERAFAPLASVFPEALAEPPGADSTEFRIIEDFLSVLEAASLQGPVAVVVDDLQWADPATLAALRVFAGRLAYHAIAIVAAYRPVPKSKTLVTTIAALLDRDAHELILGPVDRDATAQIAGQALQAIPDERLLGLIDRAHGNPLYIRELLDALQAAGEISIDEGVASAEEPALPATLPRTILRRLSFLPEEAIEALRFAAVLGSSFAPAHLAAAMGRTVASLVGSLDVCRSAGLLVGDDEDTLRFRHDLIREALYLDLPVAVRTALHLEAARALDAAGAPLALVASQYGAGAGRGDRKAVDVLHRAALATHASPATRCDLLQRAAELTVSLGDTRDVVTADLVEALLEAGRAEEAEAAARELLSREPPPELRERMRAGLIAAVHMAARFGEVVELAGHWLSDRALPDRERGRLLAARAFARSIMSGGSPGEGILEAEEALAIAEALDDDRLRFEALRGLSHARGRVGDSAGQLDAAQRTFALAETDTSGTLDLEHPHLLLAQAWSSVAFRDSYALGLQRAQAIASCERILNEGLRSREERGTLWDLPMYLELLARVRLQQERLDDALAEAEAAAAAGEEIGSRAGVLSAHLIASRVLLIRGDLDGMERHVRAAEELVTKYGNQWNDPRRARATLHVFRREWEACGDALWHIFEDLDAEDGPWSPYLMAFVFSVTGRPDRADAVCDHAGAWAEKTGTRDARFQADLSRALVDCDVEWLMRLVDISDEEAPSPDTGIWLWTSCVLARAGHAKDASRAFKRAVASYEEEAPFIVEAYAAMARAWGVRPRIRRGPRQASTGWDALTDTERSVVELASQGLTNPHIGHKLSISRRTVQTHLRHVFQKLGISSRVELAAEVARRTAAPASPTETLKRRPQ